MPIIISLIVVMFAFMLFIGCAFEQYKSPLQVFCHGIASKNLDGVYLREVRESDAEEFTIEISTEE